jgi:hypothetical protein
MPEWVGDTSAVAVGVAMFSGVAGGMPAPAEAIGSGPVLPVPESGGRELLTKISYLGTPESICSADVEPNDGPRQGLFRFADGRWIFVRNFPAERPESEHSGSYSGVT